MLIVQIKRVFALTGNRFVVTGACQGSFFQFLDNGLKPYYFKPPCLHIDVVGGRRDKRDDGRRVI